MRYRVTRLPAVTAVTTDIRATSVNKRLVEAGQSLNRSVTVAALILRLLFLLVIDGGFAKRQEDQEADGNQNRRKLEDALPIPSLGGEPVVPGQ